MLEKADAALRQRKYGLAKKLYEMSVDQIDNKADAYLSLAFCSFFLKEFHNAQHYAKKALELQTNLGRAHLVLAYIYARKKDIELCNNEIEKALEFSPNDPDILAFAGGLYIATNRIPEGMTILQKGKLLNPNDWLVHFNLGSGYLSQKQYKKSVQSYLRSFRLRKSFETLQQILVIYAYILRVPIVFFLSFIALAAIYLDMFLLILVPTIPILLVGFWGIIKRDRAGYLIVILGSLPLILYFLMH